MANAGASPRCGSEVTQQSARNRDADAQTVPPPNGRDRTTSVLDRRTSVAALEQPLADDFHDCVDAT
jgi:hypothetical protein